MQEMVLSTARVDASEPERPTPAFADESRAPGVAPPAEAVLSRVGFMGSLALHGGVLGFLLLSAPQLGVTQQEPAIEIAFEEASAPSPEQTQTEIAVAAQMPPPPEPAEVVVDAAVEPVIQPIEPAPVVVDVAVEPVLQPIDPAPVTIDIAVDPRIEPVEPAPVVLEFAPTPAFAPAPRVVRDPTPDRAVERRQEAERRENARRQAAERAAQARSEARERARQQERRAAEAAARLANARTAQTSRPAAAPSRSVDENALRARIVAHLARYKTYPDAARQNGIAGRAIVTFTVTRSGQVRAASIAGSAGAAILDQATLAMVRRAQPFPSFPEGGPSTMTITAAIRYDLR